MKRSMKFLGLVLISTTFFNCKKIAEEEKCSSIKHRIESAVTTSISLPNKPNVLLIVVDDLRYWSIKRLFEEAGMEPSDPVYGNRGIGNNMVPVTSNIDALIDGGNAVTFTNAHATATECCPSRTSLLFGKYPHQSGIYRNGNNWTNGEGIDAEKALTRQFALDAKYKVFGAGKIYHADSQPEGRFFNPMSASAPYSNFVKTDMELVGNGFSIVESNKNGYGYDIINFKNDRNDFSLDTSVNVTQDAKAVSFCINKMQNVVNQNQGKPESEQKSFFVACGIRRPHSPLIVPENIYNSTNSAVTPKVLPANITGLPQRAQDLINNNPVPSPDNLRATDPTTWNKYLKSYAGAVTYMDQQVGRLIDFINNTPGLQSNTIIILISDHGVHLGDKHHVHKTTLYEETTRVPMIWRVPGQGIGNPKYCRVPVDLMSIYPTLMNYCNITVPQGVNGRDICFVRM